MNKKIKIGIIRGGRGIDSRRERSIVSGANLLRKGLDYVHIDDSVRLIDIHIDEGGVWHIDGKETTPMHSLPFMQYYINTTHDIPRYKGLHHEIFRHHFTHKSDIHRVLSMRNIQVPRYVVLRYDMSNSEKNIDGSINENYYVKRIHGLWKVMHMPIIISSDNKDLPSILTSNYHDALEHIKYLFSKSSDVIVSQYVEGDTYTLTTMPNYRGEKYYIPIVHKILKKKYTIYNPYSKDYSNKVNMVRHDLSHDNLNRITGLVRKSHRELGINHPIQWDVIVGRDKNIYISKIEASPDFHPESKFSKCLDSTGINYIEMCKLYADKME